MEMVAGIMALGFLVLVVFLIAYVISSLVNMRVFTLFKTCNPLLGWVPLYSSYLVGRTCTGRDGQNTGLFGTSLPNAVWEFGWLIPSAVSFLSGFFDSLEGAGAVIGALFGILSLVWSVYYSASIFTFIYTRLERKADNEVLVIAILSSLIELIPVIKLLATPSTSPVFSRENDVYPVETGPSGGDQYTMPQDNYYPPNQGYNDF